MAKKSSLKIVKKSDLVQTEKQMIVRVPIDLWNNLVEEANSNNISLNSLCVYKLKQSSANGNFAYIPERTSGPRPEKI